MFRGYIVADLPNIMFNTPVYQFNLTIWLSVLTICLSIMATLIKIFRKKPNPEEIPGQSQYCKRQAENLGRIEKMAEECQKDVVRLNGENAELRTNVAVLIEKAEAANKSLEGMKISSRDLTRRLDDLLRQLMDFASS
jgi:hypothetical protein